MAAVENALVIGAGLAGLSAAIAMARKGIAVTVATLDAGGEGTSITITNRAVDAIEALGVLEACLAHGVAPSPGGGSIFGAVMDAAGNPLSVPPPPAPDSHLPAYIAIHRQDLGRILGEAAQTAGVTIHEGLSFSALRDDGNGVAVTFTDGTQARFDLVVGADGLHSSVRRAIHPEIAPIYTGTMSFRLVLDDGPEGQAGFFTLPPHGMLATVRLPRNRLYLAAGMAMDSRRIGHDEALSLVDEILAPYSAPLVRAIRARLADRPPIIARPFEWVLVPKPWHRGRIALIGDAAHATTPNLASGGSIAIEDGVVLGDELARADDLAQALDAFMDRRYARCALVVETSLEIGRQDDPRASAGLRAQALAELIKPY